MEWELLKIHNPQAPLNITEFPEGGRTQRERERDLVPDDSIDQRV